MYDLHDVRIIDHCFQWSKRSYLEAWHSIPKLNAINEDIYIPEIYKALNNPSDVSTSLLKCLWSEKYFVLIWKAFQNTE